MTDPVAAWRSGAISAEVALARLLLTGADVSPALASAPELQALFAARAASVASMRRMLADVDHADPTDVAGVARMFDAAVARAPEASVAAYSLGDPDTLARATAELVAWLTGQRLIGPNCDVLDLGCGIGRVSAALGPLCHTVLGVDVSPGMIAVARMRHAAANLAFATGDGSALGSQMFDLVLAVDSMPYMIQAGVADRQAAAAARLLRPGGSFVVLNLSYRGLPADRATARAWAARYGFALVCDGAAPFTLWDGTAFVLRRVA